MNEPILLLVEDELLVQQTLVDDLGDAGFVVIAACDGNRAIAELDADATRFKAIITDIRLPNGPDGWDLGRRARELVSDIPVIYMTGDSTHEWSSKGVPNSVVIAKPFAAAQLITTVSTLIVDADTHRALRPDPPSTDGQTEPGL
jgi:DNA-binding response OmpR family regulator